MVKHEEVDEFFRRLLAGISAEHSPVPSSPVQSDQTRQLLSAFNRIRDPRLRQELLILIEVVSQKPDLLQNRKVALAPVH